MQIAKTLITIGRVSTDCQRLLRLVYAALAETEGAIIGFEAAAQPMVAEAAAMIWRRAEELKVILEG